MSWVKVDDAFYDHPKFIDLRPADVGLWVAGLAYCNRNLTDGVVPAGFVRRFGGNPKGLVAAGLWEECDGGYRVHDYLEYQRSADEIRDLSDKRSAAGKRGVAKREANRKQIAEQIAEQTASNAEAEPQPQPEREPKTTSPIEPIAAAEPPPAADDDGFEQFWNGYPKRNGVRAGKQPALRLWRKLKPADRDRATAALPAYAASCNGFPKDAERYLRHRLFDDIDPTAADDWLEETVRPAPPARIDEYRREPVRLPAYEPAAIDDAMPRDELAARVKELRL